ncbi:MAG: TetR family transcriptional regulator [Endozoicomonas sp.]
MPRRTKEEAEETRQLLLKTALKLFSEEGLQKTTLAQVAEAAGVTRGAIYWHFRDKADMLEALWENIAAPLQTQYQQIMKEPSANPLKVLQEVAAVMLKLVASDARTQQMVRIARQALSDPLLSEKSRELCRQDLEDLIPVLEKARQDGLIRNDLTAEGAALVYYGCLDGVINCWLNIDDSVQLREQAETLSGIIVQGLRAP